jgi:hypothetical protein
MFVMMIWPVNLVLQTIYSKTIHFASNLAKMDFFSSIQHNANK